MTTDDVTSAASRLLEKAGRGLALGMAPLEGGKNNRVYRVDTAGGPLVMKRYFSDVRDTRDRLGAEWAFLDYAWSRGVRTIPEPILAERDTHTALLGFVAGRKLKAEEIGMAAVEAAADFVLALNAAPRTPAALAPGSEACFSIRQHLATIERRVQRLETLADDTPHRRQAEDLVSARLIPVWRDLAQSLPAAIADGGGDMDAELDADRCCISPSDFGFHNALLDGPTLEEGRLVFLDFEYAGRDDPAKLVCDFFCQPEAPVPLALFEPFLARIGDGLGLDSADRQRCRLLLDLYRVKWACIMLNDFLLVGAARRAFAAGETWATRCAAQIRKVEAKLADIGRTSFQPEDPSWRSANSSA